MDELSRLETENYKQSQTSELIVILDNIRSMHNVGSFFRTADAFRIKKLVLCGMTAVPPHREIQKTALGATETVQWVYFQHSLEAVHELKTQGFQIVAAEQTWNSISLDDIKCTNEPLALIVGNEVDGVNQELIELCDWVVEIPQFGTKHSLNVSVAGGILLYEFSKPWFSQLDNL